MFAVEEIERAGHRARLADPAETAASRGESNGRRPTTATANWSSGCCSPASCPRVLRGARDKRATCELARRVAVALNLPEDFFIEARFAFIVEHLADDPALLDRTYDKLRASR
jgi:hypothetical protein